MIIPIIGRSAAEFWLGPGAAFLTKYAFNFQQNIVSFKTKFDFHVSSELARSVAKKLGLNLPLETFSFSHSNHQNGKSLHVLTRYKDFPPDTFVHVKYSGYDLVVARPEFCFLQAAKSMDFSHLVFLGTRLCAQYYLQTENTFGDQVKSTHVKRTPVTTAAQIQQFLKTTKGEFGISNARRAAKYIINDANSQMEAALSTLMILPIELGGYGLPKFTMNEPIELSESAYKHYHIDALRGDFLWKKQKVIVEYNSYAFHMDASQQARDADRINAMQMSGYRVIPITFNNLKVFDSIENQMSYLMEVLEQADLKQQLKEFAPVRMDVCHNLVGTQLDEFSLAR